LRIERPLYDVYGNIVAIEITGNGFSLIGAKAKAKIKQEDWERMLEVM